MKSGAFVLICVLLLIGCGAREEEALPSGVDLTPQAIEFVTFLSEGNYSECIARFDQTMKDGLPESKLHEAWNTIQNQVGVFQKQIGVRQVREGGFDVVYVTCQFERGKIDVKVVYDSDNKVSGLWFRPAS
jgi:hypothetical protein